MDASQSYLQGPGPNDASFDNNYYGNNYQTPGRGVDATGPGGEPIKYGVGLKRKLAS